MARYIITGSYTAAGMKGMLATPTHRENDVRPLIEAGGGRLISFYVTTGENDFHLIVEGDDPEGIHRCDDGRWWLRRCDQPENRTGVHSG